MCGADTIEAAGRIVEVISDRVFRVELSNGHRLVARQTRKAPAGSVKLQTGDRVRMRISPFDLSSGRIESIDE
jgi:translation initiation factor IF-1